MEEDLKEIDDFRDAFQSWCHTNEVTYGIIIHHDDNDGLFGARMVRDWMQQTIPVKTIKADYRNNPANWEEIAHSIAANDGKAIVFVTDYNLPVNGAKLLLEEQRCETVIWRDHHKSAVDELDKINLDEEIAKFRLKLDAVVDTSSCGTELCYDYIKNYEFFDIRNILPACMKSSHVKHLVSLIKAYDINLHDRGLDPWYLNAFTYKAMCTELDASVITQLLIDESYFNFALKTGKQFYDLNEQVNEIVYRCFARVCTFEGYKVCIREGRGSSYSFGDHIDEYDAVALYSKLPGDNGWTTSLFSSKPDFDGIPIASKFGGGGHPHACGWHSATNPFADLMKVHVTTGGEL